MLSLDPASVPHGGNWARPGWWDTISTHGTWAIYPTKNTAVMLLENEIW